ncbi:MAG: hypothetical protein K0B16_09595 [Burkholderiaceae bacterium]|nr:hypothetical protein [Burkholderiaceae bacterium]
MNARAADLHLRPAGYGILAFGLLFGFYFTALTLVSDWDFTWQQFSEFWYFLVPLGAGFGLQVGLYVRLRRLVLNTKDSGTIMATSGTTSTAAMVSCCAHYLVNLAPVLGATGLVTFATQYQLEFFWIGLAFNAAGMAFIASRLRNATKDHAQCVTA